ncbi:hypothetical protein GS534_03000 [Rhodococcus hoagii]|nr:hypothetical protein [Prescottella equi]
MEQPRVAIPLELLNSLPAPHNSYWWAQPVATVVAALIALLAATIAWKGVQTQIETQRELHRKSQEADHRKQLRADRLDAVIQTTVMLQKAQVKLAEVAFLRRDEAPAEAIAKLGDELMFTIGLLDVQQVRLSSLAMWRTLGEFNEAQAALIHAYGVATDKDSSLEDVRVAVVAASDVVFRSWSSFEDEVLELSGPHGERPTS